jgi:fatty aldehyde decarbonylase
MTRLGGNNMSAVLESFPLLKDRNAVFADLLSQAITGELVGMANYAAMVRLHESPEEQCDALAHAASEMRHSERFRRAARDLGVAPIVDLHAPYWRRVRAAFLRHVDAGDRVACLVIQEVMLESFAVSLYRALAEAAPEGLSKVFAAVADEEAAHVEHAVEDLRAVLAADREAFEAKVEALNAEVMTILAEMLVEKDTVAHCGLCNGSCVKRSLPSAGLDRAALRGGALNQYLRTLDRIGVRGERSLAWIARLPV